MSIVRLVRRLLRTNAGAYAWAGRAYHAGKRLVMRVGLAARGIRYLPPRVPGGDFHSQYGQDFYLEHYGLVRPGGFYVEVGCNHPVVNSNSHYLEWRLGCEGIAIDAIDYAEAFARERPKTRFIRSIIDDEAGEADFYQVRDVVGWENQVSSLHREALSMGKGFEADVVRLGKMPLRDIVEPGRRIDMLLLDVEGHEFEVLRSLDWAAPPPGVILVENNGEFYPRKRMEHFMRDKGYALFARIGTSDDIYVKKA